MQRLKKAPTAIVAAATLAGVAGCWQTYSAGASSSSVSWSTSAAGSVPGIDSGAVTQISFSQNSQSSSCAIWSDLGRAVTGGRGGRGSFTGQHVGEGARRVDFKAASDRGRSMTVTINGTDYDVSRGALLLVSTQGGPTVVKQVEYDVTRLPTDRGTKLAELARATPAISGFFEAQQQKVMPPDGQAEASAESD